MIAMCLRTFITKILFFIFIKPPRYTRFGRHSTTDVPIRDYTIRPHSKQANKLIFYKKHLHKFYMCRCFYLIVISNLIFILYNYF